MTPRINLMTTKSYGRTYSDDDENFAAHACNVHWHTIRGYSCIVHKSLIAQIFVFSLA